MHAEAQASSGQRCACVCACVGDQRCVHVCMCCAMARAGLLLWAYGCMGGHMRSVAHSTHPSSICPLLTCRAIPRCHPHFTGGRREREAGAHSLPPADAVGVRRRVGAAHHAGARTARQHATGEAGRPPAPTHALSQSAPRTLGMSCHTALAPTTNTWRPNPTPHRPSWTRGARASSASPPLPVWQDCRRCGLAAGAC